MRSLKKIFKRAAFWRRVLLGRDFHIRSELSLKTLRLGSEYGGWTIAADYCVPGMVVYSFGVGEDISFDLDLIEKYQAEVFAFDPTPRSLQWVKKQYIPENFQMHAVGIADFDGEAFFKPPKNPLHVSHALTEPKDERKNSRETVTMPVSRLCTIASKLGHTEIDLLKLDVEGAEYDVIKDLVESELRPRQLLIEFHHRFDKFSIEDSKNALTTLRSIGYQLFATSISNEEFSFLYCAEYN